MKAQVGAVLHQRAEVERLHHELREEKEKMRAAEDQQAQNLRQYKVRPTGLPADPGMPFT